MEEKLILAITVSSPPARARSVRPSIIVSHALEIAKGFVYVSFTYKELLVLIYLECKLDVPINWRFAVLLEVCN